MTTPTNTLEQIDPLLKQKAEGILQTLGMTPLQAMSLFYTQVSLHQGLPFPLTLANLPSNGSSNKMEDNIKSSPSPEPSPTVMDHIDLYVAPENEAMAREAAAFEKMQPELQKQYPDEYVAVHNGQVVDHDSDNVELLKRRKQNYPGKIVLQRHVDAEPTRTVTIRSPRLVVTL